MTRTKTKISTVGDKLLLKILGALWIANALLFYIAGLWTIRLFQPLKVFQ